MGKKKAKFSLLELSQQQSFKSQINKEEESNCSIIYVQNVDSPGRYILVEGDNCERNYISVRRPINAIYPITDGIIIEFDNKKQLSGISYLLGREEENLTHKQEFEYFSLIEHPLNELRPFLFDSQKYQGEHVSKKIVFTSLSTPLMIVYDKIKCVHQFQILEYNMEQKKEGLVFDNTVTIIDRIDTMDTKKCQNLAPNIKSINIFEDQEICEIANCVQLISDPFNKENDIRQAFYIYLISGSLLKIFKLTIKCQYTENQYQIGHNVKKLLSFDNVNIMSVYQIKGLFDSNILEKKKVFKGHRVYGVSKLPDNEQDEQQAEECDISQNNGKYNNDQYLLYLKNKLSKKYMGTKIKNNTCIVVTKDNNINFFIGKYIMYSFSLERVAGIPIGVNNQFPQINMIKIQNQQLIVEFKLDEKNTGRKEIDILRKCDKSVGIILTILKICVKGQIFWELLRAIISELWSNFNNNNRLLTQQQITIVSELFCEILMFTQYGHSQYDEAYYGNHFLSNQKNIMGKRGLSILQSLMNNKNDVLHSNLLFNTIPDILGGPEKNTQLLLKYSMKENHNQKIVTEPESNIKQKCGIIKKYNINNGLFNEIKLQFYESLHVLNEDIRLTKDNSRYKTEIAFFLYVYSSVLFPQFGHNYANYYISIRPNILEFLDEDGKIKQFLKQIYQQYQNVNTTSPACARPYDILEHIRIILDDDRNCGKKYERILPILKKYKHGFKILKLAALIQNNQEFLRQDDSNNDQRPYQTMPIKNTFYFLPTEAFKVTEELFIAKQEYKKGQQRQQKARSQKPSNCIFLYFVNKKISLDYIASLRNEIEYFYLSILQLLRKEISEFLSLNILPRSACQLLQREDVHANSLMMPQDVQVNALNETRIAASSHNKSAKITPLSAISLINPYLSNQNTSFQHSGIFLQQYNDTRGRNDTSLVYTPLNKPSMSLANTQTLGGGKKDSARKGRYEPNTQKQNSSISKSINNELMKIGKGRFSKNLHYSKNDIILQQVYKLFDCSEALKLNEGSQRGQTILEELDEERINEYYQKKMFPPLCQRLSSFIGRGALELSTETVGLTEIVKVPKIATAAKIKEKQLTMEYIFNQDLPSDQSDLQWCQFHNGASAALAMSKSDLSQFDRYNLKTWMEYQKSEYQRYDHAGLLYGLGLHGLFDSFTISDIYFNLKEGNEGRIVAMLLGLATSKIVSGLDILDETVLKAFNLHLEYNYTTNQEVQITRVVQASAIMAQGLYHVGLCKKSLSETFLKQINARPINDNNLNREGYSLSAAMAFGLVNLCKGDKIPWFKSSQIDDKLIKLIEGGGEECKGSQGYLSSNVREGVGINTILTAPNAIVAITLSYMRTNNNQISSRLKIPETIFDVVHSNPQLVYLKVLARHLIMWNKIELSNEFVDNSVPPLIKELIGGEGQLLTNKYFVNSNFDDLDYHNLSIVHYGCITASFVALAFRHSGTGNQKLKTMIIKQIYSILDCELIEDQFVITSTHLNKLDIYTYFQTLSLLSLSLGMVMSGRCDMESYELIKKLLGRIGKQNMVDENFECGFGFQMAMQMAIGFLFLGNGALTFGSQNFQLACLYISVFPAFPMNFGDNRYYLQPLRHFYIMAAEEKSPYQFIPFSRY